QAHPALRWNHLRLGHLTSIKNQENAPQICPQANLMNAAPQLNFSLPKSVKLTTKWGRSFRTSFLCLAHLTVISSFSTVAANGMISLFDLDD
ncbi:hypothetical protein STEG23_018317, partial [Scotinomys teguina]